MRRHAIDERTDGRIAGTFEIGETLQIAREHLVAGMRQGSLCQESRKTARHGAKGVLE
jgi:hypothetical protein